MDNKQMVLDAWESMTEERSGYGWRKFVDNGVREDCIELIVHNGFKMFDGIVYDNFSFIDPRTYTYEVPPKDTVVMVSSDSKKWKLAVSTGKTDINNKLIIYGVGTFVEGGYDWKPLTKDGKVPDLEGLR